MPFCNQQLRGFSTLRSLPEKAGWLSSRGRERVGKGRIAWGKRRSALTAEDCSGPLFLEIISTCTYSGRQLGQYAASE
jgi:hypothetical protein